MKILRSDNAAAVFAMTLAIAAALLIAGPFSALCITSLLYVLLSPTRQRHRRRPPSPASGTAAAWSGVAGAAVPSSFPVAVLPLDRDGG